MNITFFITTIIIIIIFSKCKYLQVSAWPAFQHTKEQLIHYATSPLSLASHYLPVIIGITCAPHDVYICPGVQQEGSVNSVGLLVSGAADGTARVWAV
jgi:hypothetical protein